MTFFDEAKPHKARRRQSRVYRGDRRQLCDCGGGVAKGCRRFESCLLCGKNSVDSVPLFTVYYYYLRITQYTARGMHSDQKKRNALMVIPLFCLICNLLRHLASNSNTKNFQMTFFVEAKPHAVCNPTKIKTA